jgi:hypothetical protein
MHLTPAEAEFIETGYKAEQLIDRTQGGTLKPLTVLVNPGTASPEQVAELLTELSLLYRMLGGSGISFEMTDTRALAGVSV